MQTISKETYVLTMSPKNKEVARAASGDTVIFESFDCFSNKITNEQQKFSSVGWDNINPATGPLFIEEAKPGDTLKVEILNIEIEDQGVMATLPELGGLKGTVNEEKTRIIPIQDGHAVFNKYIQLPINPMIGVIGTAPKDDEIPTGTPGNHGANMDCKRITKDATLYLPVNVTGAMLAMGDAHAVMTDGEVIICGVEIPCKITVKVTVLKDLNYPLPFLVDKENVMTIASAETLDEAASAATKNMHTFLVDILGIDSTEAGMLLSVGADLKICQIVNPMKTSRMELPRWIVDKYNVQLK